MYYSKKVVDMYNAKYENNNKKQVSTKLKANINLFDEKKNRQLRKCNNQNG